MQTTIYTRAHAVKLWKAQKTEEQKRKALLYMNSFVRILDMYTIYSFYRLRNITASEAYQLAKLHF